MGRLEGLGRQPTIANLRFYVVGISVVKFVDITSMVDSRLEASSRAKLEGVIERRWTLEWKKELGLRVCLAPAMDGVCC